jgi:acyl-coenzyme A synthetase/AMP-(fatty) acid ligase
MVKRRGYRIELGEIEAALSRHPYIAEVAVIAEASPRGTRIQAVIAPNPGAKLGVIGLKQFCAGSLPAYMVPDSFQFVRALPRTSTDKIDYQTLVAGSDADELQSTR